MPRFPRCALLVATPLLSGCGGERATAPPAVARVTVTAPVTTLQFGETVSLVATVLGADGSPLAGRVVRWSSANEAVAPVTAAGVVTAGAVRGGTPDPVVVTATSEGISGSVTLTIAPVPAAALTLAPRALVLQTGQGQSLTAALRDATGGALTGRSVSWGSSAPAVATVTAQGLVTAVAQGTAYIWARSDAARDSVPVTVQVPVASLTIVPDSLVLSLGDARTLAAVARDASGAVLAGRPVTWSSGSPAVAAVAADGRVSALAAGRALVIARSETRADTAPVTVVVPQTRLVFDRVPAQVAPGFGMGIVVRATRTGADTLTGFAGVVTLQPEEGTIPFLGVSAVVARGGLAHFNELAITAAGTYRVRATAPSLGPAVSSAIAVAATTALPVITVGTITRTTVGTGFPGTSRYQLPVTLRDASGQPVGPTMVSVAIARGSGTVVAGGSPVTTEQGTATVDVTIRGTEALDLLLAAPGFQPRVQAIANPTTGVSGVSVTRHAADTVVAVDGVARLTATLLHRASAAAHALTYEVSWNPAQLRLAADTVAVGALPTINRERLAEGVLRVTFAESAPLGGVGADTPLHRLSLQVRPGATGEQRVRLVTLELRGPAGELLSPRVTSEATFRVP